MPELVIFLTLIALGYIFGQLAERRHYRSILEREKSYINLPVTSTKKPLEQNAPIQKAVLVSGSVVISIDYFKRILAGLRNFFGGTVYAYESLLDRARREAVLRLKEQCLDADQIINLRIETSSISKGRNNQIGSVEILAYGTAIYSGEISSDSA